MTESIPNILTVDVEDWFHILEVEGSYTRDDWPRLESRVVCNTEKLLELFESANVKATFFVVGWVARRYPGLVRTVAKSAHEIGSHSYWHEILRRHDRESFAADVTESKRLLEDISGRAVRGFRAPGGSITPQQAWAFDVLLEAGYEYDASLCPGYSSHGGFPGAPIGPHRLRCGAGELFELPTATIGVGSRRLPYAGGGYLRLLPYWALRWATGSENRAGRPANVYVHPREVDPEQPRMTLPSLRRFKYYVGLSSTESKLRRMLRDFDWLTAGEWLDRPELSEVIPAFDVTSLCRSAVPGCENALRPPSPKADTAEAGRSR